MAAIEADNHRGWGPTRAKSPALALLWDQWVRVPARRALCTMERWVVRLVGDIARVGPPRRSPDGSASGEPMTFAQSYGARRTTTQFWPPKPNALAAAIRTSARRAVSGT